MVVELRFLKGPNGQYYANTGAKQQTSARLSARLSTASTAVRAAVSRAARMGVELPGDVAIRVRELGGERGGLHSNGISKAVRNGCGGPKGAWWKGQRKTRGSGGMC